METVLHCLIVRLPMRSGNQFEMAERCLCIAANHHYYGFFDGYSQQCAAWQTNSFVRHIPDRFSYVGGSDKGDLFVQVVTVQ